MEIKDIYEKLLLLKKELDNLIKEVEGCLKDNHKLDEKEKATICSRVGA